MGITAEATDVIIIGAGPGGCVAAAVLRRAGHTVVMLEKQRFPRFVIGESLLPRALQALEHAGLLDGVNAAGYLRKEGAVFVSGEARTQFAFSAQHTVGYDHAYQVPRSAFDAELAAQCAALGVDVRFGTEVVDVTFGDVTPDHASPRDDGSTSLTTVHAKTEDGEVQTLTCRWVVDASGYGRVLPRLLGLAKPSSLAARKSLFSWVKDDIAGAAGAIDDDLTGAAWVYMLADDAWMWMIPFADGQASVGVVAPPAFYDDCSADPGEALRTIIASEPTLARRFPDPQLVFTPRVMAGYAGESSTLCGPGYCLVGNAFGFLDPIFSSGVTVALVSGVAAAELVVRQLAGEAVDWQAEYEAPLVRGVGVFRTYIDAWYDGSLPRLFFAANPAPRVKRQICSVLAGYVWDETNPFVVQASRKLAQVGRLLAEPPLAEPPLAGPPLVEPVLPEPTRTGRR